MTVYKSIEKLAMRAAESAVALARDGEVKTGGTYLDGTWDVPYICLLYTSMEHYRVQLIGGIILHQGRIAEMKTGEVKTLVSTLPAYLNALEGKGVHIVTVNDYLAHRDAEWMGKVHEALGLTVGVVLNGSTGDERRAAYALSLIHI